jgi:imidazolonepropionase-like amidohydrolase
MDVIVAEAKFSKAPVAAYASSSDAMLMAAKAAVTKIEHGYEKGKDDQAFRIMRDNATIFVPTLSALELFYPRNGVFEMILKQTKDVYEEGVKLACGGNTGPFAHGDNAHD